MAVDPVFLVDNSAWNRMKYESVREVLSPLLMANKLATCGVIEIEALYSARNPAEYESMRAQRNSILTYIESDDEDWQEALEIQRKLASRSQLKGSKIPDLFMAAVAIRKGLTLLHYDKDFEQLSAIVPLKHKWVVPRGSVS